MVGVGVWLFMYLAVPCCRATITGFSPFLTPCPEGWRVPDGGADHILHKSGMIGTDLPEYFIDKVRKGVMISAPYCESGCWFPFSGAYLGSEINPEHPVPDYIDIDCVGTEAFLWSVTDRAWFFSFSEYPDMGEIPVGNEGSIGSSVRCQKI